jgi:DNA-binding CsgD family transcriptional regulator
MRESLARLGRIESPAAMLRAAPAEICGCGYERALVTLVEDGVWLPAVLHDTSQARGAHYLAERLPARPWMTGSLPAPERMALKRRTPVLVTAPGRWEPKAEPGFGSELELGAHVLVAVVSGGAPVALLHVAGAGLETFDRDLVWTLAEGLGHAHERRVLVNRIASMRAEIRRMTHSLDAVMNESAEAEIELESLAADEDMTQSMAALIVLGGRDLRDSLTPREREVMELLALGLTNSVIATELVVTIGTVKSHVKNILRKLRAGNRAEAIARYIQLMHS